MKHIIHSTLDDERLEVLFDGSPCSLLCTYRTQNGFFNAVYVSDHSQDVVIEQDGKAVIVGLFSTEDMRVRKLMDYMEATIARKSSFEYCLSGDLQKLLRQATDRGGWYPLLSMALNVQRKPFLSDRLHSRISSRQLDAAFREQIRAHTTPVEHIQKEPTVVPSISEQTTLIVFSAENLPSGWHWVAYPDGSGGLISPQNQAPILHLRSDARGVEYLDTRNSSWNVFPGSVQDFRKHIASDISRSFPLHKEGLDQKIKEADARTSSLSQAFLSKEKVPEPDR